MGVLTKNTGTILIITAGIFWETMGLFCTTACRIWLGFHSDFMLTLTSCSGYLFNDSYDKRT